MKHPTNEKGFQEYEEVNRQDFAKELNMCTFRLQLAGGKGDMLHARVEFNNKRGVLVPCTVLWAGSSHPDQEQEIFLLHHGEGGICGFYVISVEPGTRIAKGTLGTWPQGKGYGSDLMHLKRLVLQDLANIQDREVLSSFIDGNNALQTYVRREVGVAAAPWLVLQRSRWEKSRDSDVPLFVPNTVVSSVILKDLVHDQHALRPIVRAMYIRSEEVLKESSKNDVEKLVTMTRSSPVSRTSRSRAVESLGARTPVG